MSEPLSGLSLTSPPPAPPLATSASSFPDDGVDMSADDEEDFIKNIGQYAGKMSSCVLRPKAWQAHHFSLEVKIIRDFT